MIYLVYFFAILQLGFASCQSKSKVKYVDWDEGTPGTNVVITVPHDGDLKPDDIPDRVQGCYDADTGECDWHHNCTGDRADRKCNPIVHADYRSSKIAMEMRNVIAEVTGKKPHMIVSMLHRSKLDPNRERDDAAQYNLRAGRVYDQFHGYIERAHNLIVGPGIHFDIHGYSSHNSDNWTELGYNIRGSELNANTLDPDTSSIRALAQRSDKTFDSLVRDVDSLGWLIQQKGYRVVPSPQYPRPELGVEGKYFRGGYITRKWGSLNGGNIDCIQIEFPQWMRNQSAEHGPKLGLALGQFIKDNYPQ